MDIDLVYLWVNGNDPKWIAKRNACIGRPAERQENCEARYADSGELKYSLRSVEKYAPWIRKIYIVTDNQVPEWLDVSNPKVQIIDHSQIMPPESLPCYNSTILEQFLYKIPGLSEHFIYANDDMYVNRPVTPQSFYAENGQPMIYMFRKRFRKLAYFFMLLYREKILSRTLNLNVQAINNASELMEKRYGKYYGDKPHHNIDAYTKNMFLRVNEIFGTEMRTTWSHHMRSPKDIQRCIYSYVALAEKQGQLCYVTKKHSFRLHLHNRGQYERLMEYNPVFFCMNDSEHTSDDDRRFSIEFLEKLFPVKSRFEI